MRLFSRVEDLDEHKVRVVSLDSVPEQQHENEVVAENVGKAIAQSLRAAETDIKAAHWTT